MAATTSGDVRAAVGVSSSQQYHYVADKDALARAVIEHSPVPSTTPSKATLTLVDLLSDPTERT